MLYVPADPRGQRAVLVVLVHGGKVTPPGIAAGDFCHTRLEVDAKPFPLQQKQTRARWRRRVPQTWAKSRRSKEECNESRLEQHPVRLVTGKILRRAHERKKAHKANQKHSPRPQV